MISANRAKLLIAFSLFYLAVPHARLDGSDTEGVEREWNRKKVRANKRRGEREREREKKKEVKSPRFTFNSVGTTCFVLQCGSGCRKAWGSMNGAQALRRYGVQMLCSGTEQSDSCMCQHLSCLS